MDSSQSFASLVLGLWRSTLSRSDGLPTRQPAILFTLSTRAFLVYISSSLLSSTAPPRSAALRNAIAQRQAKWPTSTNRYTEPFSSPLLFLTEPTRQHPTATDPTNDIFPRFRAANALKTIKNPTSTSSSHHEVERHQPRQADDRHAYRCCGCFGAWSVGMLLCASCEGARLGLERCAGVGDDAAESELSLGRTPLVYGGILGDLGVGGATGGS
jgi:hypothetical protein